MPLSDAALAVALAITIALGAVGLAILAAQPQGSAGHSGPDASCVEWSDGCTVCLRAPAGLACSTPGIACVPGARRCLKR